MPTFDQILARGEAEPVYVLEWDYRQAQLAGPLAAGATQITLAPGAFSGWPAFGYAEWDDATGEIFAWAGVAADGSALLNLRRGIHRSQAAAHAAGARLREYALWRPLLSRAHPAWPQGLECLLPPRLGAVSIDPKKGAASLSPIRVELVELPHPEEGTAPFLADLLAHLNAPQGNGLRSRRATLRLGFSEMAAGEAFPVIARGIVSELRVEAQGTRVQMELRPLHGAMKDRPLFKERLTRLTAQAQPAHTTLTVADPGNLLPAPGYARLNDELVSYAGKTATQLTGVGRGRFGTLAAVHEIDDEVLQAYVLGPENPLTLFLQVLTSTGTGANGPYDVLTEDAGLGIDAALINTAAIEQIRADFVSQARVMFVASEEVDEAKRWIEGQLLQAAGCSLLLDDAGTISVAFYGPALPATQLEPLGPDDLIAGAGLSAEAGLSDIVNAVEIRYSQEPAEEKFLSRFLLIENDSILAGGPAKKLVLELSGVHGQASVVDPHPAGDITASLMAERLIDRYAFAKKTLGWSAPLTRARLPVGAIVEVSEDRLPSGLFGEAGGRHTSVGSSGTLYEVVSRRVDYGQGQVGLELLETQFTGKRYLFFNENAAPDYAAAGDSEKRLGYLAADADTPATLNESPLPFPDGGAPYRIYPA